MNILQLENGVRTSYEDRLPVDDSEPLYLRLRIDGREGQFFWSRDGERYQTIGPVFDACHLSDEYCKYGEFTGTMLGLACVDSMFHRQCANFDFFEVNTL